MYYLFGFLPLLLLLLLLLFWLVCVCSLFRQERRHKPRRRSQKRRHKPSVLHKHCLSESPPSFIFEITHLHLQSSCLSNAVPRHQLDYMSSISIQFGDDPLLHRAASTPFDLLHMCVIFTSCKACTRQLVRPFCLTEAVCFFFPATSYCRVKAQLVRPFTRNKKQKQKNSTARPNL